MRSKHINFILIAIFLFSLNTLSSQDLSGVRICIDAGHGGHGSNDRQIFLPNGIVYWESEGDFYTALHLKDFLDELGAEVKLTRTENTDESDISLSERSQIANAFGADYFHSIHTNGGGGNYSLVLYKEQNGQASFPYAKEMGNIMAPNLEYLMKTEKNYNRGDESFLGFNLGVLKNANMPSTLSEGSFHDLPEEGLRLKNDEYLKNYAWAITRSFLSYFDAGIFETGRVGGVISDITSGEVVNEVTISCQPSGQIYTGDAFYNGFYAFGELEPGEYELTLQKEGYLENIVPFSIDANQYLDLDLTIQYYNNGYPNVDFYIEGLPAGSDELLTFNAERSTDDGMIELFEWDFGDGSGLDSGMLVQHAFSQDGTYSIQMTATDDEGKQSSISKTIDIKSEPPQSPVLLSIDHLNDDGIKLSWKQNLESNIKQYHIYYDHNSQFSGQNLLISADVTQDHIMFEDFGEDDVLYYFRMTAENMNGQLSDYSDVYTIYRSSEQEKLNVLIVDAFNRRASYTKTNHDFVATYAESLYKETDLNISSCSNFAIEEEELILDAFDMVFYFLGDESTVDETFSSDEQEKVMNYLESGGKLFVSGAETAWDLVEKGNQSDQLFYKNYLKASYVGDGGSDRAPATGVNGSGFENTTLHFGEIYPEDFPDEISPYGGSSLILRYKNGMGAGIKYRGTFENGQEGSLVNIGFPLESVSYKSEIDFFIGKVVAFFRGEEDIPTKPEIKEVVFDLYPNIILKEIQLHYELPEDELIDVQIYSIEGKLAFHQKIKLSAGKGIHIMNIDLETSLYIFRVEVGDKKEIFRFYRS